jgi:hypothetical protein
LPFSVTFCYRKTLYCKPAKIHVARKNGATPTTTDHKDHFSFGFSPYALCSLRYAIFYEILPAHVADKNFKNFSRAGSRIERSTA